MHALTESAIRRSMIDCSRSEAAALTPPRDLSELDSPSLDVLGRRDAKAGCNGNTVGTYICADPDCAHRVLAVPARVQDLEEELQALAVAFTADVLRRRPAGATMTP